MRCFYNTSLKILVLISILTLIWNNQAFSQIIGNVFLDDDGEGPDYALPVYPNSAAGVWLTGDAWIPADSTLKITGSLEINPEVNFTVEGGLIMDGRK